MFPILSFIGRSGSGKTTILEKVVTELKERNVKVAVIKHSHHDEIGLDREGKDSWRYTRSGAEIVVVSGNREFILMKKADHDMKPEEISRLIDPDVDLVLTEGFKNADTIKIEIHRKHLESKLLAKPEQLLAIVTDEKLNIEVPQYDISKDNTIELTNLVETWLSEQSKKEIQLIINDELIDLNPFVKDIISSTIDGMVSSLKGVKKVKTLQITLVNKSND